MQGDDPVELESMSLNGELSDLFRRLAAIMELKGESVFKAIAFQKVSRILRDTTVDIRQVLADGNLSEMEGIGPASQKIIEQYVATGSSADYDEVSASVPPGLIAMLDIPGPVP